VLQSDLMPSIHRCSRYSARPLACRKYPWEDAQVIFEDCVFVSGGELLTVAQAIESLGQKPVQEACMACGKCCFSWAFTDGTLTRVGRCASLVSTFESGSHDDEANYHQLPTFDVND
jgi:hypothetical protein